MFEIRVICDPDDTDTITRALATAFRTGTPRAYPTRDGMRARLYLTADLDAGARRRPHPGIEPARPQRGSTANG
ncbi:hypothetical protein ACWC4D_11415 [Streptomyces sp. NPDC001288]|uniref:hypothetical protein n=1 Tax=Streptomyces sp. NPDC001297 TaxID=3364559 RepID=UPI0036B39AFB